MAPVTVQDLTPALPVTVQDLTPALDPFKT